MDFRFQIHIHTYEANWRKKRAFGPRRRKAFGMKGKQRTFVKKKKKVLARGRSFY